MNVESQFRFLLCLADGGHRDKGVAKVYDLTKPVRP